MKKTPLKRKTPLKARKKRKARRRPRNKDEWNKSEWCAFLDKEWPKAVKARAGWKCEMCGASAEDKQLQAHHHRGRADKYSRHKLSNGIALCSNCHAFSAELSAHGTPMKYARWLKIAKPGRYLAWKAIVDWEAAERGAAYREDRAPRVRKATIELYKARYEAIQKAMEMEK